MGLRPYCDKCGHNATDEVPVYKMSVLLASVDPREATVNMRIGKPTPNRPTGEVTIPAVDGDNFKKGKVGILIDKKVQNVPRVENWSEIEYDGPSSAICLVGTQDLCLNCVNSIKGGLREKFSKLHDHGTASPALNPEDLRPDTIVRLSDGNLGAAREREEAKTKELPVLPPLEIPSDFDKLAVNGGNAQDDT